MLRWRLGGNESLDLLASLSVLDDLPQVHSGGCDRQIDRTIFSDCTGGKETACKLGGRVSNADPIGDDKLGVLPTDWTLLPALKCLQRCECKPDSRVLQNAVREDDSMYARWREVTNEEKGV